MPLGADGRSRAGFEPGRSENREGIWGDGESQIQIREGATTAAIPGPGTQLRLPLEEAATVVGGVPLPEELVESSHPLEARIHKWEARKDLGVVSAWIEAGSRPGDLVIDPFMGSGTAPLAAARLGRRAIGFDINPLALRLARLVAAPPDPAEVEAGFARVRVRLRGGGSKPDLWSHAQAQANTQIHAQVQVQAQARSGAALSSPATGEGRSPAAGRDAGRQAGSGAPSGASATTEGRSPEPRRIAGRSFSDLYAAICPCCSKAAELAHAVWSVRIACGCGEVVPAHRWQRQQGRGQSATCPHCGGNQPRGPAVYQGEELHLCFIRCESCGLQEASPSQADISLSADLEVLRRDTDVWTPAGVPLVYPGGTPFAQLRHALRARPVLDELWTGRNFLATGLIAEAIDEEEGSVRDALRISLSSIVKATSRMPTINSGGWRNKGTGLSSHLLGIFPMHLEQNAWEELERHVLRRLLPGLVAARARGAVQLVDDPLLPGDLSLREQDAATGLASLPAGSVAFAFADPPYGDAVQYAELAVPHLAWLARPLSGSALRQLMAGWLSLVVESEVVENRSQGKDRLRFERDLARVLGELHRVLRPGGTAVITFNSPDESLIRVVTDAAVGVGFQPGGIHHQQAFKASHKGSWHAGTAHGTLYLRFIR